MHSSDALLCAVHTMKKRESKQANQPDNKFDIFRIFDKNTQIEILSA
jgi:hypothetical protein